MRAVAQTLSTPAAPAGISIGPVHLDGRCFLAPLSGVTDLGFRRAAQRFGASLVVTEMVAADAYLASDEEARLRAEGSGLAVHVVQIVGRDPDSLAEAARLAEASGAEIIDINMGCPAKRVTGGLAGSALMREPDLATHLVRAVMAGVKVPVTVKMRLGWDEGQRNAAELARCFANEGAAAITVHGRTRQQFYTGRADWLAIRAVRDAIDIPLIANGDCLSLADADRMLAQSGADAVMVGRAAVGRPWLVGAIAAGLRGEHYVLPAAAARRDAALAHYDSLLFSMGQHAGVRHARKHLAAYARAAGEDGFNCRQDEVARMVRSDDPNEVAAILSRLWAQQPVADAA